MQQGCLLPPHRAAQQLAQVRREAAVVDVQQQAAVAGALPRRRRVPEAQLQQRHGARRHTRLVGHAPLNVKAHGGSAALQHLLAQRVHLCRAGTGGVGRQKCETVHAAVPPMQTVMKGPEPAHAP